ncbi:MAG: ATP-dependent helicase [Bacteroidota bacterium]|nr:ATP-dependent helicase [Bacteroidota bacterium]
MSLFDKFFDKRKDKINEHRTDDEQPPINPESDEQNQSNESFLSRIEQFALQAKAQQPASQHAPADLPALTIDAYDEPSITDITNEKINELKSIILHIESKPARTTEIVFNKKYKIDYKADLNPAQLDAVTSIKGPVLVIAGAGSGKTRVIVHRVAFMLENEIPPQNILLLTFTRKAASEMVGRVQELLQEQSVEKVFGGTFHAFSNYVLRQNANLLNIPHNFTIIDTEDSADTIDLIRSELKMVDKEKAFPKKHRIQAIISSARNRNLTIRQVIENEFTGLIEFIPQIELLNQGYEKYKTISMLLDYDDLMEVLRDALKQNEIFRKKIQDQYPYIMVDEYQDTNVVQKDIVELMSETHRNILVVGDDAQSIYSFRGANYENILRFPQKYPDGKVIKIEENYRSNQKILDFTNEIIRNARIGYKKQLHSKIFSAGLPFVKKFYDQQSEAEFIVDKILEYREKGISLNRVAILVRAFWHAQYIEVELSRRGIPYIAVGGIAFNERKHVKDVISYLRIIQNPFDAVAWHRVLKYIPGVGLVTARKIIEKIISEKRVNIDSFEKSKFIDGLKALVSTLNQASQTNTRTQHQIELIKNYYTPILQTSEPDYLVRLLDIDVLSELAGRYDTLEKFLTDFALDPPSKKFGNRTTPMIDETEDKPVTVSTIHSAKGLEWFSVFIPHALDGLIPSVRAIKNIEELEEERRLFYVACSRAKEDLIITMPSYVSTYNGFLSYPSRFLVEIDKSKFLYS